MLVKPQIITLSKEKFGLDYIYQYLINIAVRMYYLWMKPLGIITWKASIVGAY